MGLQMPRVPYASDEEQNDAGSSNIPANVDPNTEDLTRLKMPCQAYNVYSC